MQCGCPPGPRPTACLRISAEHAQTINYKPTLTQYVVVVNRVWRVFCISALIILLAPANVLRASNFLENRAFRVVFSQKSIVDS